MILSEVRPWRVVQQKLMIVVKTHDHTFVEL